MLARLTDLRTRLGVSGSAEDGVLALLLVEAGAAIERYCDREIAYLDSDQTEYLDGGGTEVRVRRWPITSIVSIREARDYDWASAPSLEADSQYRVPGGTRNRGCILRQPEGAVWLPGRDVVRVVYRGGHLDPAAPPVGGVEYVPAEIQAACLEQAAYLWQRRHQLGGGQVSAGGMGQTAVTESVRLLPHVTELLRGHRRM